ncbi:hypothetical protein HHK36_000684 [Tetracentron sinense]|uniref:Myb-like domain-containing protein n=1 Tax=Tetracentron sinense TaxID=13715 RepID=A0A834ZSD4_TETSI|nr:hypothetical protein HHK36_000684 [Tetracentron sinense]
MRRGEEDIHHEREKNSNKKKGSEGDSVEEMINNRHATDRKVENRVVDLRKDDGKKKKKKEMKKDEGKDELGFNVVGKEAVNGKDLVGGENKKRKHEHTNNGKAQENVVEFKFTKDEKNRKKEKRNKVKKDECRDDADYKENEHKKVPDQNCYVGERNNVKNLEISKDEESGNKTKLESTKDEKKKRKTKEKRNKDKEYLSSPSAEILKDKELGKDKEIKEWKSTEKEECTDIKDLDGGDKKNKKNNKKGKKDKEGGEKKGKRSIANGKEVGKGKDDRDGIENIEYAEKRRNKGKKDEKEIKACLQEILTEKLNEEGNLIMEDEEVLGNEDNEGLSSKTKRNMEKDVFGIETEKTDKKKRKKTKTVKDVSEGEVDKGVPRTKKRTEGADLSRNSQHKGTPKRVRFSGHVEVFPTPDVANQGKKNKKKDLVQGKRFSLEEDEMVKEAVSNYIKGCALRDMSILQDLEGLFVMRLRGAALPWRPHESIYYRAHILFERAEVRAWTPEEYELIRRVHEERGSDWKALADVLGKHRFHVKDTWRRIKLPNMKKGRWSQEEYQSLFDLVNMDLRMKAFEEKKSKHGMLRDNICWGAISDKLSTRIVSACCEK